MRQLVNIAEILEEAPQLARAWAAERHDRQERTQGDPADYQALREIGLPLMAMPVECGGTWENLAQSARPLCTLWRTLAQGDPSITLASAMHHLSGRKWPKVADAVIEARFCPPQNPVESDIFTCG